MHIGQGQFVQHGYRHWGNSIDRIGFAGSAHIAYWKSATADLCMQMDYAADRNGRRIERWRLVLRRHGWLDAGQGATIKHPWPLLEPKT